MSQESGKDAKSQQAKHGRKFFGTITRTACSSGKFSFACFSNADVKSDNTSTAHFGALGASYFGGAASAEHTKESSEVSS
jgi:hypothetical protein